MKYKDQLLIFLSSLIFYILFNIWNYSRHGWHVSWSIESWWYYASALTIGHPLQSYQSLYDINGYIIGACLHIYKGIQTVHFVSIVWSSIASVLVFLIARRFYGRFIGISSAVIFTFLPSQFYWRTAFFTHDVVIIPFFLSIIFLFTRFIDTKKKIYLAPMILLWIISFGMNITLASTPFFLLIAYDDLKKGYLKTAPAKIILLFLIVIGALAFDLLAGRLSPYYMGGWIMTTPVDVQPLSFSIILSHYSVFLLIALIGIVLTFKSKEYDHPMFFTIFFAYFVLSLVFARALRYVDFPLAVFCAVAFDRFAPKVTRIVASAAPLVILSLLIAFPYFSPQNLSMRGTTEAQYDVLNRFSEYLLPNLPNTYVWGFDPTRKVLSNWDLIWMVAALTPLEGTTAGQGIWWASEEEAWKKLNEEHISYIFISYPRDFYLYTNDTDMNQALSQPIIRNGQKLTMVRRWEKGREFKQILYYDEKLNLVSTETYYNVITKIPPPSKASLNNVRAEWLEATLTFKLITESCNPEMFELVTYRQDEFGNFIRIYKVK